MWDTRITLQYRLSWTFCRPQKQQLHERSFTSKACVRPRGRLSFQILVHGHPSMVSVIMVTYITGRNEFNCCVRLFESWLPICGSACCCLCVLFHVVALRGTPILSPPAGGWNVSRPPRWHRKRLFLLSTSASVVIRGQPFLILWCSILCVFLMWNN